MTQSIGAVVSLLVGAALAAVISFAAPAVITGTPEPVTEPLVTYGSR
jgi:hypothetical protein